MGYTPPMPNNIWVGGSKQASDAYAKELRNHSTHELPRFQWQKDLDRIDEMIHQNYEKKLREGKNPSEAQKRTKERDAEIQRKLDAGEIGPNSW